MNRHPAVPVLAALILCAGGGPPAAGPSRAVAAASADSSPAPGTATTATPREAEPPPSPVSGIRGKLSAGDLLSAESILEVHREREGEDGPFLVGMSWLARGALLVGDLDKSRRYAAAVRARCADSLARGADLERSHDLEIALGAAIEVRAQLLAREKDPGEAAEYVRGELARIRGPAALTSRLNKRINMLTMAGTAAPELVIEDFVGARPPSLASLRGRPVLLFLFAQACGDCKAQAAALGRARAKYASRGLELVAVTRYYMEAERRGEEKARIDSVWTAVYSSVGRVPIVVSTASMVRYGGSSTPTFIFLDREGIVRWYTPTRLTDADLDRSLEELTRAEG